MGRSRLEKPRCPLTEHHAECRFSFQEMGLAMSSSWKRPKELRLQMAGAWGAVPYSVVGPSWCQQTRARSHSMWLGANALANLRLHARFISQQKMCCCPPRLKQPQWSEKLQMTHEQMDAMLAAGCDFRVVLCSVVREM